MISTPSYSGEQKISQHLAKGHLPGVHKPPQSKKGQNPLSIVSDDLGWVQKVFIGMT